MTNTPNTDHRKIWPTVPRPCHNPWSAASRSRTACSVYRLVLCADLAHEPPQTVVRAAQPRISLPSRSPCLILPPCSLHPPMVSRSPTPPLPTLPPPPSAAVVARRHRRRRHRASPSRISRASPSRVATVAVAVATAVVTAVAINRHWHRHRHEDQVAMKSLGDEEIKHRLRWDWGRSLAAAPRHPTRGESNSRGACL